MPKTMTFTEPLVLVVETCPECFIQYGLPRRLYDELQAAKTRKSTCCPNGHRWHYTGESAEQRALRAETRARAAEDQAAAAERSARAYRGVATRIKNRAAAGTCPAPGCRRHFENLGRHMASQHPGFAEDGA